MRTHCTETSGCPEFTRPNLPLLPCAAGNPGLTADITKLLNLTGDAAAVLGVIGSIMGGSILALSGVALGELTVFGAPAAGDAYFFAGLVLFAMSVFGTIAVDWLFNLFLS